MTAAAAHGSRIARSRSTAADLSRWSLPLPHLGDCTHDGQPSWQPHVTTLSSVARQVAIGRLEAELGHPGPTRHGVVDHDRRLLRCRPGGRWTPRRRPIGRRWRTAGASRWRRARWRGARPASRARSTPASAATRGRDHVPDRPRHQRGGGQVKRLGLHHGPVERVLALVADDGGVHLGGAEVQGRPADRSFGVDLEQPDLRCRGEAPCRWRRRRAPRAPRRRRGRGSTTRQCCPWWR